MIEPDALGELVGRLAALGPERARLGARHQARPRRHHPRLRARARSGRRARRLRRDRGHRGRAARGRVPGPHAAGRLTSRCSRTCAPPRCATWPSSTSPTSSTSSTSPRSRCRCSTRWSPAACSSPPTGERELLWAASMLHDVGMTISYDDHHKHSRYLIESAELPGFDPRERALIAQISRYHRKGVPKLGVIEPLSRRGDEELLDRCAVILRLAEHLERGRDQSVSEARLRHQRRRRRPAPAGRRRPHPAALERRALRRRRGVRAGLRPPAADRLTPSDGRLRPPARVRPHDVRMPAVTACHGAIASQRSSASAHRRGVHVCTRCSGCCATPRPPTGSRRRAAADRARRRARPRTPAARCERSAPSIDACLASPKLRALQTAQLACEPLGVEVTVDRRLAGEPFDVEDLVAGLGDVLLVGHDPSFSLTLHDLTGAQARMRKGGLAGDPQGRAGRAAAPGRAGRDRRRAGRRGADDDARPAP